MQNGNFDNKLRLSLENYVKFAIKFLKIFTNYSKVISKNLIKQFQKFKKILLNFKLFCNNVDLNE